MREKILFNDNWKFLLKDNGSELSDVLLENDWHDVEVPHDWLIGDTNNLYKSGDGWYRKEFYVNKLTNLRRSIRENAPLQETNTMKLYFLNSKIT